MTTSAESAVVAPKRVRIDSRRHWFPDLRSLCRERELVVLLSRRNLTAKYRQTILGAMYVVASPLLSAFLFTFVFGHVANLKSDGEPYFAFSYAGLLAWNIFLDTFTNSSASFVANVNIVTKIYFPRLVLPLSTVAVAVINATISLSVMVILLFAYHIGVSVHILLLPVWLLLSLILALGFGIALTSLSVIYRDVTYISPFIVSFLLYLTPVAYSANDVPHDVRPLYMLNPMVPIVEGCRWSLLGHGDVHPWAVLYAVAFVIVTFIASLSIFARLEWRFADVI